MQQKDWIDVKDSLPEFDHYTLVFGENQWSKARLTGITIRKDKDGSYTDLEWYGDDGYELYITATHWMPIVLPTTENK